MKIRHRLERKIKQWITPLGDRLPPLYLVGGAVRDLLLDRPTRDVDLAVADPQALARLLRETHNASMVVFDKKPDSVCYRVVDRSRKTNYLDIVSLTNGSIEADLRSRDFTINSIAVRIQPNGCLGRVIDPLAGRQDLSRKRLRCTSPDALTADPLRMLRGFRLMAELDFDLDQSLQTGIQKEKGRIAHVAAERITTELMKIFASQKASQTIHHMDRLGLLEALFPEIVPMINCPQNRFHHLDVWRHSLLTLENLEQILQDLPGAFGKQAAPLEGYLNRDRHRPLLKLAALLHDIGKPHTFAVSEDGRIGFHHHDSVGATIVEDLSNRLRLPAKARDYLITLVAHHLHILFLSRPDVKEHTIWKWIRKLGDDLLGLILLEMADCQSILGPAADRAFRDRHLNWSQEIVNRYFSRFRDRMQQKNLINGNDLIAIGLAPGPQMGKIIAAVREAQDLGRIRNFQEGISFARHLIQTADTPAEVAGPPVSK